MFLKFTFQAGVFKAYREESSELSEEVGWKKMQARIYFSTQQFISKNES